MRTIEEVRHDNRKKSEQLYLTEKCVSLWQNCKLKKLNQHAEEAWKCLEASAILEWGEGTCCTLNADKGIVEIEHLDGRKKEFFLL